MTVQDLIEELQEFPLGSSVYVAVEVVEGHDVRVVKSTVHGVKLEDEDVIVELG